MRYVRLVGLVPSQVVEIVTVDPSGVRHRASGYQIGSCAVLTAAHVVEDVTSVALRFNSDLKDERTVHGHERWIDIRSDLAVVTFEAISGAPAVVEPEFGQIGSRAAVLPVYAVGFPRWKLRRDVQRPWAPEEAPRPFRDSEHVVGSVAVLSNWREGTLSVAITGGGPPSVDPIASPWGGMSGAALWAGDVIVGVISRHYGDEGTGRLTANRLDRALDQLDTVRRAALRRLVPTLPEYSAQLRPVLPGTGTAPKASYEQQLREIAPDPFLDREAEIDDLVAFCGSADTLFWWQASPWAGKSALLAWFALNPPAGVDVISFFITRRFVGQSAAPAFLEALCEQLCALHGRAVDGPILGRMLQLLQEVGAALERQGRLLLVVIDGLDEDTGPDSGHPSIASLLPRTPPPGVRILVSSRPLHDMFPDVEADHPLRTTRPRSLSPSPHARDLERRARRELLALLRTGRLEREILGFLSASGGGLTSHELAELTSSSRFEIETLLERTLHRSVGTRIRVLGPPEHVYLFAHDTLRESARDHFGQQVDTYRDRLVAWAGSYRDAGWPPSTPGYLITGYPQMLGNEGHHGELLRLVADSRRHECVLTRTGGDSVARAEIESASLRFSAAATPDLGALLATAVERQRLTERNSLLPPDLPVLWATIGESDRALALAHGLPRATDRAAALLKIAGEQLRQHDRSAATDTLAAARSAAERIDDDVQGVRVKIDAFRLLSEHDDVFASELFEDALHSSLRRSSKADVLSCITALLKAVERTAKAERAPELLDLAREALSVEPASGRSRFGLLEEVVSAASRTCDVRLLRDLADEADVLSRDPEEPRLVVRQVKIWLLLGDLSRAERLAKEAPLRVLTHHRDRELAEIAHRAAELGDEEGTRRLLREVNEPGARVTICCALLKARGLRGDVAGAKEHYRVAVAVAREPGLDHWSLDSLDRSRLLAEIVQTCLSAGLEREGLLLVDSAVDLLLKVNDGASVPGHWSRTLLRALLEAGHPGLAEKVAGLITDPIERIFRAREMANVVAAFLERRDTDAAARVTDSVTADVDALEAAHADPPTARPGRRQINDPLSRYQVLHRLAMAWAYAGRNERAEPLVRKAERTARLIENDRWMRRDPFDLSTEGWRGSELVRHLCAASLHRDAETVAAAIANNVDRDRARQILAQSYAQQGELARGQAAASMVADRVIRACASVDLIEWVPRNDPGGLRVILRATLDSVEGVADAERNLVLVDLARALVRGGWRDEAVAVADRAEASTRRISNVRKRALGLARVASLHDDMARQDQADRAETDAVSTVFEAENTEVRSGAMNDVLREWLRHGQPVRAERTVRRVYPVPERARQMPELVRTLVASDRRDRALDAVLTTLDECAAIVDLADREKARASLLSCLVKLGAVEAVRSNGPARGDEQSVLLNVARAQTAAGDLEAARRSLGSVTDSKFRDRALADLVLAYLKRGRADQAKSLFGKFKSLATRGYLFGEIALTIASNGDFEGVEAWTDRMGDETDDGFTTYLNLVGVAKRAKEQEWSDHFAARAEQAARALGDRSRIDRALARLASVMEHQPGEARRKSAALLAEVLRGDAWDAALEPLAEREPAEMRRCVALLRSADTYL